MSIERALIGTVDGGAAEYVEDVFSTYLYTGTGTTQTITNGIDLSGKGGLVWVKPRSLASDHRLVDTVRGGQNTLTSNSSATSYIASANSVDSFTTSGFVTTDSLSGYPWVSWTFRKAPKFFDVVTYTGNGAGSRSIPHNLGSVPGFIVVKCTSATSNWTTYHRSFNENLYLNSTGGSGTVGGLFYISGNSTSSNIVLGTNPTGVNESGQTYVAYLFADNAGGFGASGTDSVISCGSFTCDASGNATVNLGWEPQWIIAKRTDTTSDWLMLDNMRGFVHGAAITTNDDKQLLANSSAAETTQGLARPLATGFDFNWAANAQMVYIAIRRPMKTPTSGASVFAPIARTGDGSIGANITGVGFPPDFSHTFQRSGGNYHAIYDRLRGASIGMLDTASTSAEGDLAATVTAFLQDGITVSRPMAGAGVGATNTSGQTYINHLFRRAPGFFDVVCYTGTGLSQSISHGLGVKPELMFIKVRSNSVRNWIAARQGNGGYLNTADALSAGNTFLDLTTGSTTTTFDVNANPEIGGYGQTYVAYLFASCPGVSKFGSYTGNGSSQTINCGFAAGARFILIKRTDSTGDWYVWDTARGIVSANDPHLSLNTTAAEVTTDDSIDPDSTGFIVNQVAATNINVSSATYIYLAIA